MQQIPAEQRDAVAYGQGEENREEEGNKLDDYLTHFQNEVEEHYINMPNGALFFQPLEREEGMDRNFYNRAVNGLLENANRLGEVKLNADLTLLLRNKNTGELKFWYPGQQSSIASNLTLNLKKSGDLKHLIDRLCDVDINERVYKYAPNSEWEVLRILGLRFIISYL